MYQQTTIVGYVGKAGELKYTKSGEAIYSFSVATSQRWQRDGEWQEKTTWWKVTAWGKQAETYVTLIAKGAKVMVAGTVGVSAYTAKDGSPAASLELRPDKIVMLSSKSERTASDEPVRVFGDSDPSDDEDIPF